MYVDRFGQDKAPGIASEEPVIGWTGESARSLLALDLSRIAPAGHYLALRVGFAFPIEEVNELPRPWVEHYTSQGYIVADPVIRWMFANEGPWRWSDITAPDPFGVLAAARQHGLNFGACVSLLDRNAGGQRSFGFFLRVDREFCEDEMCLLQAHVVARHEALAPPQNLTPAELESLRLLKTGMRLKEIAFYLGTTEGAIKQRLKNARAKLDAKTGAGAISRATAFGLI